MDTSFCIHWETLGGFHLSVIVNNAAVTTGIQVPWVLAFSSFGIAGLFGYFLKCNFKVCLSCHNSLGHLRVLVPFSRGEIRSSERTNDVTQGLSDYKASGHSPHPHTQSPNITGGLHRDTETAQASTSEECLLKLYCNK